MDEKATCYRQTPSSGKKGEPFGEIAKCSQLSQLSQLFLRGVYLLKIVNMENIIYINIYNKILLQIFQAPILILMAKK